MEFVKKNIIGISLIFIIVPIIIFLFGFLKIYWAILFSIIILLCYYKIWNNEKIIDNNIKFTKIELIVSVIIILIWLFFSGIGNFSYQNTDWDVRNAVFRDLIEYEWPVIFSTGKIEHATEDVLHTDKIGFVYYFTYWLPAALIGKVFGLTIANIFLYIWTFVIIMLILYLLKVYLKKNTYLILYFLIFFSGMDILAIINKSDIFGIEHLEWWSIIIQYSSNTTLLYWVFNQSIISWLITILILIVKKESSILFIAPLLFAYSPFATIGIIPIVGYLIIKKIFMEKDKKNKIIKLIFSTEMLNILLILLVFGTYYLSADSSISKRGFILNLISMKMSVFIILYCIFIFVEVFIYFLFIIKNKKYNDGLFKIICIELMLIPFYKMTKANDFCMRVSIVPLFILMIYFIRYVSEIKKQEKITKIFVILIVLISIVTPLHEIFRSFYFTLSNNEDNIKDKKIYSIGNPKTEAGFRLCNEQFYNKNLGKEFFSKYLLKEYNK